MAEEAQGSSPSKRESRSRVIMREKQPISIPFIWEEKPGMPKKDWKPIPRPVEPPAPPVKFVVSVPFGWEEKPGIPFPGFIHPPKEKEKEKEKEEEESLPPITDNINNDKKSSSPCSPPGKLIVSVPFGWEEKPGTPLPLPLPLPALVHPALNLKEEESLSESESQLVVYSNYSRSSDDDDEGFKEGDEESWTCSVESDDSFISAKSLLANGLISTATISNAVPVHQNSLALPLVTSTDQYYCPASETDSDATSSLAGASFLEWLFPLLVPHSNVSNNLQLQVNACDAADIDIETKENLHGIGRPLLTLGDLIAMSRRRSCQRKVVNKMHIHKHNHKQPSMEFLKRNAFGCCIFETGNEINRLSLKWKKQLQLKLFGNEINQLSLKWKRQN